MAFPKSSCPSTCRSFEFSLNPTMLTAAQLQSITDSDEKQSEDADKYVQGGYIPLKSGARLGPQNEYVVIRKLGWGSFSTSWLCRCDKGQEMTYYAIKISKGNSKSQSAFTQEIDMFELMKHKSVDGDSGFERIVFYHTQFVQNSAYGKHICLVEEVMGPTLLDKISLNDYQGLDKYEVKLIVKQILEGVRYLHEKCRVIHSDLKIDNILVSVDRFYIRNLEAYVEQFERLQVDMPHSYVTAEEWSKCSSAQVSDPKDKSESGSSGKEETNFSSDSYHLCKVKNKRSVVGPNISIKICDFGCSFLETDHHPRKVQARANRSIEVMLRAPYSFPIDVWSVGCITYELLTGAVLFHPGEGIDKTDKTALTRLQLIKIWNVLDGIPPHIATRGRRSSDFFNSEGRLMNISDESFKKMEICAELMDKYGWKSQDATECHNFIMDLIQPDPDLRATASIALNHKWLEALEEFSNI